MKFLPQCPGIRAALLLGFLAMAAIGWKAADRPAAPLAATEKTETSAARSDRPARPPSRFTVPSEARARVAALRAIRSPEERMRATIQMANTMPIAEIEGWLEGRWFELCEGYDLTLFNKITKERWQAEDPEGLVRWLVRDSSGNPASVIADWAQREPAKALAYLTGLQDPSTAVRSFTQLAATNPALALEGFLEIAAKGSLSDGNFQHYSGELLRQLAKSAPGSLEAVLGSLPLSLRQQAEAALMGGKLTASFSSGIRELWDRPDGWKIFQTTINNDRKLGANLFGELANLPPGWRNQIASNLYSFIDDSNAAQWIGTDLAGMGFTESDSKRILQTAMSQLARSQPETALKLLAKSDLAGNERLNVIGNLFGNLGGNPEKAEALMRSLATEEERAHARGAMSSNGRFRDIPVIENPGQWLETVKSAGDKNDNSHLLSTIRNWDKDKMAELGTQFRTMPDEEKGKVALLLANDPGYLNNMDPSLKGAALQHLISHPPEVAEGKGNSNIIAQPSSHNYDRYVVTGNPNLIAQSSKHAVNWVKSDPAAATAWVQSLPNGDAKTWAQKNLAANWVLYDPQEAGQWVNSLPADTRQEVREYMKNPDGK